MTTILKRVNRVYKKQNPSSYIAPSRININNLMKSREKLLFNLKFPKKMFFNAKLIDLGSGSGLYSLVYNKYGANCTLVEYEKKFCQSAKKLFKKFADSKFKIIKGDILKLKIKKKFDIVTCNGVAHHTLDPDKVLKLACSLVKKNGFIIWGIGNKSGFFQRAIQRIILYKISKNDEDITKFSKILFSKHLRRASFYGGRTLDQIIYDTYINPKINNQSIDEIVKIITKNGLNLYSSYPEIITLNKSIGKVDTQYKNFISKKKSKTKNKEIYLSEHQWISFTKERHLSNVVTKKINKIENLKNQISTLLNDKNFDNFRVNYQNLAYAITKYNKNLIFLNKVKLIDDDYQIKFFNELKSLFLLLNNRNLNNRLRFIKIKSFLKKSKFILREKCGVGMTYFIAMKQ